MVWGLGLAKGDEVILTTQKPCWEWLTWLNELTPELFWRTFEPQDTQEKNLEEIKKLINSKPRVVSQSCPQRHIAPQVCFSDQRNF